MKRALSIILSLICIFCKNSLPAQPHFTILPLGVYGGSTEGNLSAYLIAPASDTAFVALDGGTIMDGLKAVHRQHYFKISPACFLRQRIKGYLITHPHLDHVAGLIINSPEDNPKNIYGLPFTIKALETRYFTWSSWANFADEGEQPTLNKYHYIRLKPEVPTVLKHTKMEVTAFELSHAHPGRSTAYLIKNNNAYFLYLGDTGDDKIEGSQRLHKLWEAVAPLLKSGKLKGISIECSFPEKQPDNQLFGHLKPSSLISNLTILDRLAGGTPLHHVIAKLPVIIAHIKPVGDNEQIIHKELKALNQLDLHLIFPKRGKRIAL